MPRLRRVAVAVVLTLVVVAIALAVVDLYLTGNGRLPLGRPWIAWPALGVHLSRADSLLILACLVAGAGAWLARPAPR